MKYSINVIKELGYFKRIYTEDLLKNYKLSPLDIIVGEIEGKIIIANLKEITDSHLFINGTSGSGKSAFLMNVLISLYHSTGGEYYAVTPKKDKYDIDFTTINNLLIENIFINQYRTIMDFLNSTLEMMEMVYDRYDNRMRGTENSDSPIFLFIDEVQEITLIGKEEKKENQESYNVKMAIRNIISEFSSKSRAANIYMIFGTQTVRTDILNGRDLANFPKITFKTSNLTESNMIPELPASNTLAGAGHGLIRINGEVFEFQSPMPDVTRYQ